MKPESEGFTLHVLVTGGAGFIGSHLVSALIGQGHEVSVIDNLSVGERKRLHPDAKFYSVDLRDRLLASAVQYIQPDVVYHLAAQSDVRTSALSPSTDAATNISGTIALLEACRLSGARKIIFASSAAVYGTPQHLPIAEQHPLEPESFYGLSKLSAERYLALFCRMHAIDYTILRYSNVYGPGQGARGEGGVVSIFLHKLARGESPVFYGDGTQTRDFIHVRDVVAANLAALGEGSGGTFNISTNVAMTVRALWQLVCERADVSLQAVCAPARAGDIVHSRLDNRLARERLSWHPQYTLAQGLAEMIRPEAKTGIQASTGR